MKHPTVGSMEHNRLVEWRGSRKDPYDWPGCGVNDESRDHSGACVVKVETEKVLSLPGDAGSRPQGLVPKSRSGKGKGAEWGNSHAIAIAGRR
jgi:hypothetical protein